MPLDVLGRTVSKFFLYNSLNNIPFRTRFCGRSKTKHHMLLSAEYPAMSAHASAASSGFRISGRELHLSLCGKSEYLGPSPSGLEQCRRPLVS